MSHPPRIRTIRRIDAPREPRCECPHRGSYLIREVCNFSGSCGSGHTLVPLLLLHDRRVERRDLHLNVVELGATARSDDSTASFSWSTPGFGIFFFGRVVVLHGAPKDL